MKHGNSEVGPVYAKTAEAHANPAACPVPWNEITGDGDLYDNPFDETERIRMEIVAPLLNGGDISQHLKAKREAGKRGAEPHHGGDYDICPNTLQGLNHYFGDEAFARRDRRQVEKVRMQLLGEVFDEVWLEVQEELRRRMPDGSKERIRQRTLAKRAVMGGIDAKAA